MMINRPNFPLPAATKVRIVAGTGDEPGQTSQDGSEQIPPVVRSDTICLLRLACTCSPDRTCGSGNCGPVE